MAGGSDAGLTAHAYKTLYIWRHRAQELTELHDSARAYYRRANDVLTISSLALGTLSGSTALFTGGSALVSSHAVSGALNVALGCLGVLSTILMSVNRFIDTSALQEAHNESQRSYNKLAREITVHLHLDRAGTDMVFSNIHQCLRYMQASFDDLEDQAPAIPSFILRRVHEMKMTQTHLVVQPVFADSDSGDSLAGDVASRELASPPPPALGGSRRNRFSLAEGDPHPGYPPFGPAGLRYAPSDRPRAHRRSSLSSPGTPAAPSAQLAALDAHVAALAAREAPHAALSDRVAVPEAHPPAPAARAAAPPPLSALSAPPATADAPPAPADALAAAGPRV